MVVVIWKFPWYVTTKSQQFGGSDGADGVDWWQMWYVTPDIPWLLWLAERHYRRRSLMIDELTRLTYILSFERHKLCEALDD